MTAPKSCADASKLPTENLTVCTWVNISKANKWGSIVGHFQDNGKYERGWTLGYQADRISLGLSTGQTINYIKSTTAYKLNEWYHLAMSFDSKKLSLFINGKKDISVNRPGNIVYDDKTTKLQMEKGMSQNAKFCGFDWSFYLTLI